MYYKKIFNRRIANQLVNLGFKVQKYEINRNNPLLKVYIFESTPEFLTAFEQLKFKYREDISNGSTKSKENNN
jgi:hypothetical protein